MTLIVVGWWKLAHTYKNYNNMEGFKIWLINFK